MDTRLLGGTAIRLSALGLGTWAMGGPDYEYGWGAQSDDDSLATIRKGLSLGINWIDTAPAYGLGRAEEVVGRALRGLSERPLVATKFGLLGRADGSLYWRLKDKSVREECDGSLRRLGSETIDLYLMHWPKPEEDLEEAWTAVAALARAGKVRAAGACNVTVPQLRRLQAIHPVACVQVPYSLLVRTVEDGLLDYCARARIGVVVYSPLQKGLLTGSFTRERARELAPDDHRRRDPDFQEPALSAHLNLLEGLRAVSLRCGVPIGHLALAWVLRRPEVASAIVGARRPEQIAALAGSDLRPLPTDELQAVERLLARRTDPTENPA